MLVPWRFFVRISRIFNTSRCFVSDKREVEVDKHKVKKMVLFRI
jgi:hypothetical protein